MEFIVLGLMLSLCFLFLRLQHFKNKCDAIEKQMEKLSQQKIYILLEKPDINDCLEERFCFIHAENIVIHNMDKWFYKKLEQHRDFYEAIVRDSQEFKEMLKKGMLIRDIRCIEEYEHSADVCFDLSMAIMGEEIDGIIHLDNGRHRCMIAKELGVEVPIYITGKYITKRVGDIL